MFQFAVSLRKTQKHPHTHTHTHKHAFSLSLSLILNPRERKKEIHSTKGFRFRSILIVDFLSFGSEMDLPSLAVILQAALSPNPDERKAAEQSLNQVFQSIRIFGIFPFCFDFAKIRIMLCCSLIMCNSIPTLWYLLGKF